MGKGRAQRFTRGKDSGVARLRGVVARAIYWLARRRGRRAIAGKLACGESGSWATGEPGRDGMVEHPIVTWRVAGWNGVNRRLGGVDIRGLVTGREVLLQGSCIVGRWVAHRHRLRVRSQVGWRRCERNARSALANGVVYRRGCCGAADGRCMGRLVEVGTRLRDGVERGRYWRDLQSGGTCVNLRRLPLWDALDLCRVARRIQQPLGE